MKFIKKIQEKIFIDTKKTTEKVKVKVEKKGVKRFLADFFYKTGTTIEVYTLAGFKIIFKYIGKGIDLIILGLKGVFKFFGKFLDAILDDLGEPIAKIGATYRKLKATFKHEQTQSNSFKGVLAAIGYIFKGFFKNKMLVGKLVGYIVPTITAIVFVVVVSNGLTQNYAIDVLMDGEIIGTVENYTTVDKADSIIQNQLVSTSDQEWNPQTEIKLITLSNDGEESVIGERELANNILNSSSQNIVQATGLYVGGEFYGATENGDVLQETIDGMLAPYQNGAENRVVSFVQDVSMISGVYFSDSIKDEDEMVEMITGEVSGEKLYTTVSGDSPSGIAQKNGITLSTLYQLNPGLEGGGLWVGDELLVGASVPFLQVKYVETEVREQIVPHEKVRENNNSMNLNTSKISQAGVDGVNELVVEVEYIDGIAVKETVLSTTVISEPVTEITQVGTLWNGQIIEPGSGVFLWPTTNFRWSRGFTGQYPAHNGIDLAASYGTPIVAVDSGIVVDAAYSAGGYGWHVEIQHGNGYQTLYAHCSSLNVSVGQSVSQGQVIAYIGSTGWSTGNHIHFEVKSGGYRYDPMGFLP